MTRKDYVSHSGLRGWAPLSGASTTFPVPRMDALGPCYVKGLHGFRPARDGKPASFDSPSTLLLFDAQTGEFQAEEKIEDERRVFPIEHIDEAALARLGATQDRLAPHFFDGEASVPKVLASAAEEYRTDFRLAIQTGHRPFYESHSREWITWVGLL